MEQPLQIGTSEQAGVTILEITGRVDANTSFELESQLSSVLSSGTQKIILQMSRMVYISSSGLRVLLAALKKLKQSNGELVLVDLQQSPKEVMKMTGFDRLFKIFPTTQEALSFFSP